MNRRKELAAAFEKQAVWFPFKKSLKALKLVGADVAKAAKSAGETNIDAVVDKVLAGTGKVVDNATEKLIKEMRFTGLVGLGLAGVGAGAAGAVVGPFANRLHRELQAVEKATGLPISGDLPGEVRGSFVEGFSDKTKHVFKNRILRNK